jgi:prevent-host-death family protein
MPARKSPAARTVNIHDAKTRLSQLIERVEAGEEIVIARAGRPVARLSPLKAHLGPRRLGRLDGCFRIPDDFNAPLPDDVLERLLGGR